MKVLHNARELDRYVEGNVLFHTDLATLYMNKISH